MASAEPLVTRGDALPWSQPYRLIGWAERERLNPLVMAFGAAILTWMVFQGVAALATALLLHEQIQQVGLGQLPYLLPQYPNQVFGANAIGQLVGLLMVTILLVRLHTPDVFAYIRVNRTDPAFYVLSAGGLLALMPFVSWVGEHARRLPYPDWVRAFDEAQQALIEQILAGEVDLVLALLFVALTPAICEEVIFRGYLQRNVERRLGAGASVVLVGLLFGLFHLRLTEFIPLSMLGIYLGYVVWVSGSLWTAVLVHLLNNGIAVVVSNLARRGPEPVRLDEISVPWHIALLGLAVALTLVHLMWRRRAAHRAVAPPSP